MLKTIALSTLLATVTLANAQSPTAPDPQASTPTQPAAPIVRNYPSVRRDAGSYPLGDGAPYRTRRQQSQVIDAQPIAGVWLRSASNSVLSTVSATAQHTEIRLDHGRLNVSVHQPAQHAEILIDLPGGQTSLLKDGLYTFNADTNTVRVLRGEAAAYPGPISVITNAKPIKIKEDHQLSLVTPVGNARPGELKSVEAYPYELAADLLQSPHTGDGYGDGYAGDYPHYGGYPYYAGGYGYPYAYPGYYPGYYGYGYPFSYGIGIGYYGGFGGGYRGGGFRR